jgi:hypothetical protein
VNFIRFSGLKSIRRHCIHAVVPRLVRGIQKIPSEQNINEVYATFLGDLFAAERHKYIPVGLLPPSLAAKIRLQKIPSEGRYFIC